MITGCTLIYCYRPGAEYHEKLRLSPNTFWLPWLKSRHGVAIA